MYEELVKRLRELEVITEHCGEQSCSECANKELCDKYDNKTLTDTYKDAADAIEELQQTAEHYKGCADDWYKEACDYKAMLPRWIPVTERLPEKRKWVLCRCEAGITDVLRYKNAEWYHDPTHVYFFDFVTHWMPLPEPPKEEV